MALAGDHSAWDERSSMRSPARGCTGGWMGTSGIYERAGATETARSRRNIATACPWRLVTWRLAGGGWIVSPGARRL